MVTMSTAFLGLTLGCARCHDHKYEPLSQVDYYSMLGFLSSVDPYGQHHQGGGGRGTGKIQRALVAPAEWQRWERLQRARQRELEAQLAAAVDPEKRQELESALKRSREEPAPFEFALAVAENGPQPKPTRVLIRGDAFAPGQEVIPAFPSVFGLPTPPLPERPSDAPTTGRRSVLAEWIASRANPLTARVLVNRVWQHHFGVGLVATPDDFGRTGTGTRHQPLLDYLAAEFMAGGWHLKRMHRMIMMSRAYRMSSSAEPLAARSIDEANTRFWRQNLRRAEAEVVRDTMLAVSGMLNARLGGPSVFSTLPPEIHGTQDAAGKGWSDSPVDEQNRRSIYLVVKRALRIPLLECLDFANSASATGMRPVTTTAPQALMLLNDSFVRTQAAALAERIGRETDGSQGGVDDFIVRGFQRVLQRSPSSRELEESRRFLAEGTAAGARAAFCRVLLNLNETIYVD
jgi:hypothetical protein